MTRTEENLVRSVSRSFYLSLTILPAPVRPAMALGYMLCRAADTIADTDALPRDNRLEMLQRFLGIFTAFPVDQKKLAVFIKDLTLTNTLPKTPEGVLLTHFEDCVISFSTMPPTHRSFLQNVVAGVIEGMIMDLETFGDSVENARAFQSDSDLERYLALIGGEPGRFWTNLLLHEGLFPSTADRDLLFKCGISFGKGLQMVNILKDLPEDLKRGRCYIPEERLRAHGLTLENLIAGEKPDFFLTLYHERLAATAQRLENGLAYINQCRPWDLRLRAAVWWPLALGLKTLRQLRQTQDALSPHARRKIKRSEVYKTMATSLIFLPSEKGLRWEFKRLTT